MRKERLKQELMDKYSLKDPKFFLQINGCQNDNGQAELWSTTTIELMSGSNVRVLIPPSMNKTQAMYLLGEILKMLEEDQTVGAHWKEAMHEQCELDNSYGKKLVTMVLDQIVQNGMMLKPHTDQDYLQGLVDIACRKLDVVVKRDKKIRDDEIPF